MVRRTVWFSLFCLIGLALLVSVRALAPFGGKAPPKTQDSFDAEEVSLAIKSDRLVAVDDEVVPEKTAIRTIKVVFPAPAAKDEAGLTAQQKSWRPVYASMRARAHHKTHRHTRKRHRHQR